MHLLFLGAGAIGTYVGGSLASAGHQVSYSEQPAAAAAIAAQGLRLTRDGRTTSVRDFAIFDSSAFAVELVLRGFHGSVTEAERRIPVLLAP